MNRVHVTSISNDGSLPIIVYRKTNLVTTELALRQLRSQRWTHNWSDTELYTIPHYHSNTAEVLVCCQGVLVIRIGYYSKVVILSKGDAVILPTGTIHSQLDADNCMIVGGYPFPNKPDTIFEKPKEEMKQSLRVSDPFCERNVLRMLWKNNGSIKFTNY